jgi:hypothetical protein
VENLFHIRPPFAWGAVAERLLAGLASIPPVPRFSVDPHFRHIRRKIVADAFEVAEKIMGAVGKLAETDRIIPDIAVVDHAQNSGPYGSVQALVLVDFFRFYPDGIAVSFQSQRSMRLGSCDWRSAFRRVLFTHHGAVGDETERSYQNTETHQQNMDRLALAVVPLAW